MIRQKQLCARAIIWAGGLYKKKGLCTERRPLHTPLSLFPWLFPSTQNHLSSLPLRKKRRKDEGGLQRCRFEEEVDEQHTTTKQHPRAYDTHYPGVYHYTLYCIYYLRSISTMPTAPVLCCRVQLSPCFLLFVLGLYTCFLLFIS